METLEDLRNFFLKGYLEFRPNLTVDCAILGYHSGELKVLLEKNRFITQWCLPGGYVKKTENLEEAAARITAERTGIQNLFLQQFKTFGDLGRNAYNDFDPEKFFEFTGIRFDEDNWLSGETVSVGFYAITDIVNAVPKASAAAFECAWFAVDDLPDLAFDHRDMVKEALNAVRIHLYHFPVGKNLLPTRFTLREIKQFYEVMSGKELHASNFPNKLISLGLIVKTDEKKNIGAHRSPAYYMFSDEVYQEKLREGLVLV